MHPARRVKAWEPGKFRERSVRRLSDYHTVAFTREADSKPSRVRTLDAKFHQSITAVDRGTQMTPIWRDYLLDARFIVLLPVVPALASKAARALRDPVWGVWLGRKACVPSSPVLVVARDAATHTVFPTKDAAWEAALAWASELDGDRAFPVDTQREKFPRVEDADFDSGTDTWSDAPLSFGRPDSSGVEGREFSPRRVHVVSRSEIINHKS